MDKCTRVLSKDIVDNLKIADLICKETSPSLPPPHLHNCAHSWCSSAEAARHLLLPSRLICSLDALVLLLSRLVLCFLGLPPALGLAAVFHLCRSWWPLLKLQKQGTVEGSVQANALQEDLPKGIIRRCETIELSVCKALTGMLPGGE